VVLSSVAGAVDALGFITLGGFFVSFMTGNTTRLTVGLAEGRTGEAATGAVIILLFVAGAIIGFLAVRHARFHPKQAAAGLLTLLLSVAAILHDTGHDRAAVGAMILAMGSENAIFQVSPGPAIGLTYMTGTLVRMARLIVDAVHGEHPLLWLSQFVLWFGLAVGAGLGGLAWRVIGLDTLWPLAAISAAVTLLLGRIPATERT
jgi:uncharacterized membrane protein YoaK (UPF0700 family)